MCFRFEMVGATQLRVITSPAMAPLRTVAGGVAPRGVAELTVRYHDTQNDADDLQGLLIGGR